MSEFGRQEFSALAPEVCAAKGWLVRVFACVALDDVVFTAKNT